MLFTTELEESDQKFATCKIVYNLGARDLAQLHNHLPDKYKVMSSYQKKKKKKAIIFRPGMMVYQ